MKTIRLFIITLSFALLCSCNSTPSAPKYESILDEVLSCMVTESSDDIHLVQEDQRQLIETFRYHSGFGKITNVKNLREYLFAVEENMIFNTPNGVEAFRLEKDIYGPAVDSLCTYVEEGGQYPSAQVIAAIHHLQEQYARAMDIDMQIGIGAAIWLNRFTEQAVKYCPDIRLLTENCDGIGGKHVGIIEMAKAEHKPLTNIIVTDFDGERQISFGINMLVNRVEASFMDGTHFLLWRDAAPGEFEAFVMIFDTDGNPEVLTGTNRKDNVQTVREWMSPAPECSNLRLFYQSGCSLDLIVDKGEKLEVRTLRYQETGDTCRFVFDPMDDISVEDKPCFREVFADLDGDTDALLDSLSDPSSAKWDNLFSVQQGFLRECLPGEYSHRGNLLAIVDGEEDVAIADYSRRQILKYRLDGDGSTVISIQFSPDDSEVLVQSWSGRTAKFDVKTGNLLEEVRTEEREIDTRIAYDWNKSEGYVGHGNKLLRLKLNEGLSELVDTLGMPIYDILPYRDSELLVNGNDGILVYNPATRSVVKRIPFGYRGYRKVAVSHNRRYILGYNSDGVINLWDTEAPENYWTMDWIEGYGNSIGFSNDGTKFIFIDGDRKSVTEKTIYTNL